jgi:small subunit ribosomal protein S16
MLKIRLQRIGKKNTPHFRLVLTEKSSPVKSKALEILGHYNPREKDRAFKKERILHWVSMGAQVSDTAFNLLHNENILEGQKIVKKKISKRKREELKKKAQEEAEQKAKETEEKNNAKEVKEDVKKEDVSEDTKKEAKEDTPKEEKKESVE